MTRIVQAFRDRRQKALLDGLGGYYAETFDRRVAQTTSALTGGTIYLCSIGLKAGDVVTSITVICSVAGATTSLAKVGLYDSAGNRLALSADASASFNATGAVTLAMTTPYTVPADGLYYIAGVFNGGTVPGILSGNAVAASAVAVGSGVRSHATGGTGQTDLPETVTPSGANARSLWAGVS